MLSAESGEERLELKDILQINATVIAGAIVLMTINAAADLTQGALNRYAVMFVTIAIIMPFAGSSLWAFNKKTAKGARQLTQGGFIVLIIGLVALGVLVATDQFKAKVHSTRDISNSTALSMPQMNEVVWYTSDFWVAVGTAALAIATFLFLLETRKARIEGQQPSFAVEPAQLVIGAFLSLNLVNHGRAATDINVRCKWGKNLAAENISAKSYYVLSLAQGGYAGLSGLPIDPIIKNSESLEIEIKCRDVNGKPYESKLLFDFTKVNGTDLQMAFQYNYQLTIYDVLDRINKEVRDVARSIDKLTQKMK